MPSTSDTYIEPVTAYSSTTTAYSSAQKKIQAYRHSVSVPISSTVQGTLSNPEFPEATYSINPEQLLEYDSGNMINKTQVFEAQDSNGNAHMITATFLRTFESCGKSHEQIKNDLVISIKKYITRKMLMYADARRRVSEIPPDPDSGEDIHY